MKFTLIPICLLCLSGSVLAAGEKPISVRTFERDGIGETGTFEADDARASAPKGPPILSSTSQKQTYKHYDVDITNRAKVAGEDLRVEYVVYTVSGDGRLISNAASAPIDVIAPGDRASVKTRGATLIRAKTTTTTIGVGVGNQVQTGSKTSRSKERFGGVWVRVYKGDKIVGEARDLSTEVEKVKPAWKSPKKDGVPSIFEGIKLPEITIKPPKLPIDPGKLPAKPPFPKPPF
jgi:hypothetical protein